VIVKEALELFTAFLLKLGFISSKALANLIVGIGKR